MATIIIPPGDDIQSLMDMAVPGDEVVFGEGTHAVESIIQLKSGITITASPENTVIHFSGAGSFHGNNVDDISIHDLNIVTEGRVFNFVDSRNVSLKGNSIQGDLDSGGLADLAIDISDSVGVDIDGNTISDLVSPISILDSSGIDITGNTLSENGVEGGLGNITVSGSDIDISENVIFRPGRPGPDRFKNNGDAITVLGATDVKIEGNSINEAFCYGMWIKNSSGVEVIGNEVSNGLTSGIYLTNTDGVDIRGNTIEGNTSKGILVDSGNGLIISENVLEGDSIFVVGNSGNVVIESNTVKTYGEKPLVHFIPEDRILLSNNTFNEISEPDNNERPIISDNVFIFLGQDEFFQKKLPQGIAVDANGDDIDFLIYSKGTPNIIERPPIYLQPAIDEISIRLPADSSQHLGDIKARDAFGYAPKLGNFMVAAAAEGETPDMTSFSGSISAISSELGHILVGGESDDRLFGNGGDDTLRGGAGDDLLIGGTGRDTLDGGEGFDTADYSAHTQAVLISLAWGFGRLDAHGDGLEAIEAVIGGSGDDLLYGANYVDNHLVGGAGDDFIWDNVGDDTLSGQAGDDNLTGGRGNDTLHGGAGDDLLIGGIGHDILDGGEGFDTADYSAHTQAVLISLAWGFGRLDAHGDSLEAIEAVIGGSGDDLLYGANYVDNHLVGGAGDDFIWDNVGDDTLSGQAGDDSLTGGRGNDTLHGGTGDDLLIGGLNDDTFMFKTADFTPASSDTIIDFGEDKTRNFDTLYLQGHSENYTFSNDGTNLTIIHDVSGASITVEDFSEAQILDQLLFF